MINSIDALAAGADLNYARETIKRIIDENFLLRSAAVALGIYDKAILYLPELLWIISEDKRGKEILKELGLDDFDAVANDRKT